MGFLIADLGTSRISRGADGAEEIYVKSSLGHKQFPSGGHWACSQGYLVTSRPAGRDKYPLLTDKPVQTIIFGNYRVPLQQDKQIAFRLALVPYWLLTKQKNGWPPRPFPGRNAQGQTNTGWLHWAPKFFGQLAEPGKEGDIPPRRTILTLAPKSQTHQNPATS